MPGALHLELLTRRTPTSLFRNVQLRQDGKPEVTRVSYEILPHAGDDYPASLDGFVFGLVLHAMKVGLPLHVHGPLSRSALYNLAEVQSFWNLWRPGLYKRVEIVPDRVVDLERTKPKRRAVAAFSGGVDSTFTALRHRRKLAGNGSYELDTVLMVQGFDVSLANTDHFQRLLRRTEPFLSNLGLDLRVIRTNSKELNLQRWEDTFVCQLACCLHQYSHEFEFALVGSSNAYNGLVFPWGSTPVTDPLYSGDALTVVHDGAGFSRSEKVAAIAHSPLAVAGLKVCWEGHQQDENCGVCEKCVRTRLNFLAVGEANPACFDGALDLSTIEGIPIRNHAQYMDLRSIVEYAEGRQAKAEWLVLLKRRLRRYRREAAAARRRERIAAALDAVGMKMIVKRGLQSLGLMR